MDVIDDCLRKDEDNELIKFNTVVQELMYIITIELERNIKRALDNNKKYMILYTYERNKRFKDYNMYYLIIGSKKYSNNTVMELLKSNDKLSGYNIDHYFNVRTHKNEIKVVFKEETDGQRIKRLERRDRKKIENKGK